MFITSFGEQNITYKCCSNFLIHLSPLKDVEKYKYQVPEGKGNRSRGKNIHYIISLHPDGSYDIETKLYWVQKYQLKWN